MMHRTTSSIHLLFLLLLLAPCDALSLSLWVPGSRPSPRPGSSSVWWARQRQEELRLMHAAVAARRRLGQRTPVKQPPSPNPNGRTVRVKPVPPPPISVSVTVSKQVVAP